MDPIDRASADAVEASWPERLRALGSTWRSGISHNETDRALGEIWVLLNLALGKYVRQHARRVRRLSPDDVLDIAAEKASELLRRLDSRDWNPSALSSAQLCGFLAAIARNGVVDFHRVRLREVSTPDGFDVPFSRRAWGGHEGSEESPASGVDGATYARAIADCAAGLTVRARRAWYLRVFYEIGSAEIARDPVVATTPAGVDAMLARCREQMRSCLARKGLTIGPLPPGTFVRLWNMTRRRPSVSPAPPDGVTT